MQNRLKITVDIEGDEEVKRDTKLNRLHIANLVLEFYNTEAYEDFRESIAEALELVHPDELTSPEQYLRWRDMRKVKAAVSAAAV
jgi:hypothetical protein